MKKYNIKHYYTGSSTKPALAERVIRTLKTMIFKNFAFTGKFDWIDHVQKIVKKYNNSTFHSTIHTTPRKVCEKNEKQILRDYYTRHLYFQEPKFKVGDHVRLSKYKKVFEKSYECNWTNEIFVVHKVMQTFPVTYVLKDSENIILHGVAYEQEMMKTKYLDTFLIEEVLKKRRN